MAHLCSSFYVPPGFTTYGIFIGKILGQNWGQSRGKKYIVVSH